MDKTLYWKQLTHSVGKITGEKKKWKVWKMVETKYTRISYEKKKHYRLEK